MKKAVIKIRRFGKNKWLFLDYQNEGYHLLEKRMVLDKKEDGTFQIISGFPFLHENGISGEIENLKLARKAIKYLKALEQDIGETEAEHRLKTYRPDKGHENLVNDLDELLDMVDEFDFHDFRSKKLAIPKVELRKRLLELADNVVGGKYDN